MGCYHPDKEPLSIIELSLRTIGAGRQHVWCGGLTLFVLGINKSVEDVRKVRGCRYNTIVYGVVCAIA